MSSPRVSVIIPVRNGEKYLRAAIDSILAQTHPPFEVIVVNNGSSDGTRAVAEQCGGIVRVIDQPLPGLGKTRNAGVAESRGEILAFLDADDLWDAVKLERQLAILYTDPKVDLVFTGMQDFISPDVADSPEVTLGPRDKPYPGVCSSSMVVRRAAFDVAGPIPDLAVGEFIAWYGLAQAAGLASIVIPDTLVRRRIHLTNMSRRSSADKSGYLKAAKMVLDARRKST